jgi:hypothetical protein
MPKALSGAGFDSRSGSFYDNFEFSEYGVLGRDMNRTFQFATTGGFAAEAVAVCAGDTFEGIVGEADGSMSSGGFGK